MKNIESSNNKVLRVEIQMNDDEKDINLNNKEQLQQYDSAKKDTQILPQTQIQSQKNPYILKYENALGQIHFEQSDIVTQKSCCSQKRIGAPIFPTFQNKLNEIRPMPFKRVLMLINPTSGGGNGKKVGLNIISQLQKHSIPNSVTWSASVLNFYDFIETFDFNGNDLLMVCGGDGSIFMTLNILAKRQAVEKKLNQNQVKRYPLAVIPGGTGNDFCSSLGFNHIQASKFVENYLLVEPKVRQIDIGRCRLKDENGNWKTYYFSCQSGVGFAGRVDIKAKRMGYLFRLKYKVAAFMEVLSAQTDIMTVIVDGVTVLDKGKVKFVEVNNVPRTGGGFRACPIAQVNDRLLDCIVMYSDSKKRMINTLQDAENNGLHIYGQETTYFRGKEIRIICHDSQPVDMEIDGEDFKCTEVIYDLESELVDIVY